MGTTSRVLKNRAEVPKYFVSLSHHDGIRTDHCLIGLSDFDLRYGHLRIGLLTSLGAA